MIRPKLRALLSSLGKRRFLPRTIIRVALGLFFFTSGFKGFCTGEPDTDA